MMFTPDSDDLGRRLRALVAHHVPAETRAQHVAAIDEQLLVAAAPDGGQQGARPPRRWARRWVAGLAAATAVLTPGAVAAQNTVPGDVLYPLKQATEQVQSLVSPAAVARNRVVELAALLAGDAARDEMLAAAEAARAAVARLPADHPLHTDLAALLGHLDTAAGSPDRVPTSPPHPGTGADTDTAGADEPDDDGQPHPSGEDDGAVVDHQDDAEHGDEEDEPDGEIDDADDAEDDDAEDGGETTEAPADEDSGGDTYDPQDHGDTEDEPGEPDGDDASVEDDESVEIDDGGDLGSDGERE